ncbi:protein S100-A10a [Phyllopteryx taeniolatus]|uniref:protein S100-A10a n=1 Tax=Phyllopteryx taeniolatus TaxID=161469 RepID=UPI002AD38584|nr:protein S100-A10a [Phyllopteryx taeniolatus]
MPSQLETAMESLILVFHRYASKDGKTGTLSRRALRDLMSNELSNFLKCQKDPAAVDKIMKDLDTNGDGQVDFEEFVSLVVGLSIACEQCYQARMKNVAQKKSAIMGEVQTAIFLLIDAFKQYAGTDGDKNSMSKAEVKEMFKKEFGLEMGKAKDQVGIDRIFKDLDANSDNKVDFQEFVCLVASLAMLMRDPPLSK